jgi:hypothetical protein
MRSRQCVPLTICIVLAVHAGSQIDAAMSEVQPAAVKALLPLTPPSKQGT